MQAPNPRSLLRKAYLAVAFEHRNGTLIPVDTENPPAHKGRVNSIPVGFVVAFDGIGMMPAETHDQLFLNMTINKEGKP